MDPNQALVDRSKLVIRVSRNEERSQEPSTSNHSLVEGAEQATETYESILEQYKFLYDEICKEEGRSLESRLHLLLDEMRLCFEKNNLDAYADFDERCEEVHVLLNKLKEQFQKDIEQNANASQIIVEMQMNATLILEYLEQLNLKKLKLHAESLQWLHKSSITELRDIKEIEDETDQVYKRNNFSQFVKNTTSAKNLWSVPMFLALAVGTLILSNISAGYFGNFMLSYAK